MTSKKFFNEVKYKTNFSQTQIAKICKVHKRTVTDWKKGISSIPHNKFEKLIKISNIDAPKHKTLSDNWHIKGAAKKGGVAYNQLYGNPGTPAGRSRGGKTSIKRFSSKNGLVKHMGFITRKDIQYPKHSTKLAEFIGIVIGDGGISNYQITITLHHLDDKKFAQYVQNLTYSLFKVQPTLYHRESTINIIISRVRLVHFLINQGLCIGSKVKQQVGVPSWINNNDQYTKASLRGLFDTDGCFYIDKHSYKSKIYLNCGMNFTNRSLPILNFFKNSLENIGLNPTQKTKYSLFLRKESEIIYYFNYIGTSNSKHFRKYQSFFKNKYGEVPKWS